MVGFQSASPEDAATQIIRDYCGWHVAPVLAETITLDGTGTDAILLPSRRVVDITGVTLDGVALATDAFEWSASGMLRRLDALWPERYRVVKVELLHGFDSDAVLSGLVAAIAARIKSDPTGAITNQRAGTQSVSFGSAAAGHGLLSTEKASLEPYRLTWGP